MSVSSTGTVLQAPCSSSSSPPSSPLPEAWPLLDATPESLPQPEVQAEHEEPPGRFPRWLSTLRRRAHGSPSLSGSSIGFLATVKSASLTLGPHSQLHSDMTRSSMYGARMSIDSCGPEPAIDSKAWYRSIQRRSILDEILSSEESYISDMKAMINIYYTLLASAPTMSPRRRASVHKAISQIIHLHEELLAELQKVVPSATATIETAPPRNHLLRRAKHSRWHSLDSSPKQIRSPGGRRRVRHSVDMSRSSSPMARSMAMSTITVLSVAKVFDRFMRRFLAYEAYVAHHTLVHEEASTTSRLVPAWSDYERGVEALSATITSLDQKEQHSRKGLTLADLVIKPVQRICKYPLFFADLCKHTPACDDPVVHEELAKVLQRLQDTAEEINFAMDNPTTRHRIETTWLLQDRLKLRHESDAIKLPAFRLLGHVVLCGVLHVTFDGPDGTKGRYMVCILYRSWFLLATVGHDCYTYHVEALISLTNASVEACDNGRGLQCHTAPYTWKVVFQYQQKYYEVLLSACSEQEEEVWKNQLLLRMTAEAREHAEGGHISNDVKPYLATALKSLGPAFEAHSGFTRRVSIRRAATLGPRTSLRQVIIKNTHAHKSGQPEPDETVNLMRSKSHLASGAMPTLAPRRSERVRLEGITADIWSRDLLPYPGMANRRPENSIRASANSVMRKLSMASIASNFSRSMSFSGPPDERAEELRSASQRAFHHANKTRRLEKRRSRVNGPVDIHNDPLSVLPDDFELKKPSLAARGQNLVKRAMTMDATKSPGLLSVEIPRVSPTQSRCASTSQILDTKNLTTTPQQSDDSGYLSIDKPPERPATTTGVRKVDNERLELVRGPTRVRNRIFRKLLGVH